MTALEELRYLILAAQREGTRALSAALRSHGLTPSQAEALEVLSVAGEPLTVKQVGDRLVCEHGSPSRLMSTLTDKGWVEAMSDERDSRATLLRLTRSGRAQLERVMQAKRRLDALISPLLERRSGEVEGLRKLLRAWVADLPAGRALAQRIADETRR